jgi:hypothetical protein
LAERHFFPPPSLIPHTIWTHPLHYLTAKDQLQLVRRVVRQNKFFSPTDLLANYSKRFSFSIKPREQTSPLPIPQSKSLTCSKKWVTNTYQGKPNVCVMQEARSSLAREMEVWTLEGFRGAGPFYTPTLPKQDSWRSSPFLAKEYIWGDETRCVRGLTNGEDLLSVLVL